ncbi:MAG TPA: hypothetical protein VFD12_09150 [Oligella sp.]|nr:hypothetical protein [Oligella sp.]
MDISSTNNPWPLSAELVAVLVATIDDEPMVLTTHCAHALPAGELQTQHRSLQNGLRVWVEALTGHSLGYVEQLYTFADKGRAYLTGGRVLSVSYLAFTRERAEVLPSEVSWQRWYSYFPWEDWRHGKPALLSDYIEPQLSAWAAQAESSSLSAHRQQRIQLAYGLGDFKWNEDLVLPRFELLYEADLVPEAMRDHILYEKEQFHDLDEQQWLEKHADHPLGRPMRFDQRRMLATGMARLRAKIKYRPVVFELMPPTFTLLQLQTVIEALAGRVLHKQNFRRLVEQQNLVEETGEMADVVSGRPPKLFRFRPDVILERTTANSKFPLARQSS